ncbi:DNA-binding response regulator [Clostridia bacterium]|nr:DNA-binding response regulator [Clostridia bacterium]
MEREKLIYIADDEKNIRDLIVKFLEKERYDVEAYETGDDLFKAFTKKSPDLVILDVMMPGSDGLSICRKIRSESDIPIIMLTARDSDADYIAGITLGSDDYFTKPVSMMQLVMRIRAIFRRIEMDKSPKTENRTLRYANISIDLAAKSVTDDSAGEIALTPNEYNLLVFMFENMNRAVSRDELLDKIWGFSSEIETRVADDTVKRLRKKLTDTAVVIDTVWGFGFKLKQKDDA